MSRSLTDLLPLLPDYFARHLLLSLLALAIGLAISLPLGVAATRIRSLRTGTLALASVIQTVPSLALLALMVPLLGMIGFVPALIALVLYSMLPVLRNTVTGIDSVDPALVEAARGVGMTGLQSLLRVELPVAAPVILAGVRTAAVWVVGIATLATPVGQTTLGNFIFTGLQTQNQSAVIVGCVAAAFLALSLDGLLRLLEYAVAHRSRLLLLTSAGALTMLLLAGLSPTLYASVFADPRPPLVIGAKTFTEQYIMAEMLSQQLRQEKVPTVIRSGMGSQLLFDALSRDAVDCYVDYSGTIWTNVMQRTDTPPRRTMIAEVRRHLADRYGIRLLGRLGFENTYCLAMRRDRAAQIGIRSISDLQSRASDLKLAGDVEFFGRPEWTHARDTYDLRFAEIVPMDAAIMYSACANQSVDVIAAFSTDGRITAFDLLVLQDDRHAFPPYDAIVLLSPRASRDPSVIDALSPLLDSIDDDLVRRANMLVDVDGQSPATAAQNLLATLRVAPATAPVTSPATRPGPPPPQ